MYVYFCRWLSYIKAQKSAHGTLQGQNIYQLHLKHLTLDQITLISTTTLLQIKSTFDVYHSLFIRVCLLAKDKFTRLIVLPRLLALKRFKVFGDEGRAKFQPPCGRVFAEFNETTQLPLIRNRYFLKRRLFLEKRTQKKKPSDI